MAAYDEQNVFARILRGEIPAYRIYEDDATIAILDVMPQCDGHALVIPRAPSRNILDVAPEDLFAVMRVAQRVARAAIRAFAADGVNIMQFNEAAAGQTIFHTHLHVMPRKDGVPLRPHSSEMAPADVMASHAEAYRRAIAEL
jgi:histidine triad (HIT) family protein